MTAAAQYEIAVGAFALDDVLRVETTSAMSAVWDTAEIVLDNADGRLPAFKTGDGMLVRLGYRGESTHLAFLGAVTDSRRKRTVRISAADPAYALRAPVTRAWRNCTPGDIAADILAPHGLRLRGPAHEQARRPHWVAHGESGKDVLLGVARAWALDWSLCWDALDGAMWWGPWAASPRFARWTRAEILVAPRDFEEWHPAEVGQRGSFVTLARPQFEHSQVVSVLDEEHGAAPHLLRLDRVRHILEAESAELPAYRTEVEWTRLA